MTTARPAVRPALAGLVFVALGLLVYSSALPAYFVADDFMLVRGVREDGPFGVWTYHGGWLRPMVSLSFYLDYRLWGLNPLGFHLTNILLHALNAVMVSAIAYLLLADTKLDAARIDFTALTAGLLFLVLPSHAESVAWIAGRTDVVAAFFGLGAFLFYLLFKRHGRTRDAVLSLGAFALALLSKESAVTLPLIIGLYELLDRRYAPDHVPGTVGPRPVLPSSPTALLFLGYLGLIGIYLGLRYRLIGELVAGYGRDVHLAPLVKPYLLGWLPIFWVRTFWPCCWPAGQLPAGLTMGERVQAMFTFYLSLALVTIAGLALVAWLKRPRADDGVHRRLGRLGALCLWLLAAFAIAQLPAASIGMQVENTLSERFTYIPSAFVAIFIALVLAVLLPGPRRRAAAVVALVLVYTITLRHANTRWREAGDLARSILASFDPLQDTEHKVIVLTLPDHLGGALIFRSGLRDALALQGKITHPGQVQVLSHMTLHDVDDAASLLRQGSGLTLRSTNDRNVFITAFSQPQAAGDVGRALATVKLTAENLLQVDLPGTEAGTRYLYYSAGRLLPVPEE